MQYSLSLNDGPTLERVIVIALLLFVEVLAIGVLTITSQGRMPNQIELTGLISVAVVQLVTYILTFLKKEGS